MLLVATTEAGADMCDVLASWAAAGLVAPFGWWCDDGTPLGRAELVAGRRRRALDLAAVLDRLLAGRPAHELRVVAVALAADEDGPRDAAARAAHRLQDRLWSTAQPLLPAEDYRRPAMLVVPRSASDPIDESLVAASFSPVLVVAPEDRAAPDAVSRLADLPGAGARHAAHAVASVGELWRDVPPAGERLLDALEPPTGPASVQVVRAFSRFVDSGYLVDHVAAQVLRPVDRWPNPAPEELEDREPDDDLCRSLVDTFMDRHTGVLGLTPFEPVTLPGRRKLTLWEALRQLCSEIWAWILRLPGEWLNRTVGVVYDTVAEQVERLAAGDGSGVQIRRWRDRDPDTPVEDFFAGLLDVHPQDAEDGAVGPAWRDYRVLCLALTDGSDLPAPLRLDRLTAANMRLVVRRPAVLLPHPDELPPGADPGQDRACDPLHWEAALAEWEAGGPPAPAQLQPGGSATPTEPQAVRPTAPTEPGTPPTADAAAGAEHEAPRLGDAGNPGDRATSGDIGDAKMSPDGAAAAGGDVPPGAPLPPAYEPMAHEPTGPAPTAPGSTGAEPTAMAHEPAHEPPAAVPEPAGPQVDAAEMAAALRAWLGPRVRSLGWRIGGRLGANIRQADDESRPPDVSALHLDRRAELVEATARRLRRNFLRYGVAANTALAFVLGGVLLVVDGPVWVRSLGLVGVAALWVLILAFSWRSSQRRVDAFADDQAANAIALLNRLLLRLIRTRDAVRLRRRYGEYLDWSEVLGVLLYRPFVGQSIESLDMAEPVDPASLPAAMGYGLGLTSTGGFDRICSRARHRLFQRGWLTAFYAQVADRLLVDRAELLGYDIDAPGLRLPDPAADTRRDEDGPRRWVVRGIAQGTHRGIIDSPMGTALLGLFDDLPLRYAAEHVAELVEVGQHPLGPTGVWVEGSEQLERRAEALRPCVVGISASWATGSARGTGVVLTADGLVATSAQVVEGASLLQARLHDGTWVDASPVGRGCGGVALLQLAGDGVHTGADLADPGSVGVGARVFGLGHIAGLADAECLSWGIVTVARRPVRLHGRPTEVLHISCPVLGGGPGSPVFDLAGRVVGLVEGPVEVGQAAAVADHVSMVLPVEDVLAAVEAAADEPAPAAQAPALLPEVEAVAADEQPVAHYLGRLRDASSTSLAVGLWAAGAAEASKVQDPRFLPARVDSADGDVTQLRLGSLSPGTAFLRPVRVAVVRIDVSNPMSPKDLEHFVPDRPPEPSAVTFDEKDEV